MSEGQGTLLDGDVSGLAFICRLAIQARRSEDQLPFLEALLADLTEFRDDLAHQAGIAHHSHQEL